MRRSLLTAVKMYAVALLVLGVGYPLVVTGLTQLTMPARANGSIVRDATGAAVGSELLGQAFESPAYFHPRPSAAGDGYDALASGGSNLGPTSRVLDRALRTRAETLLAEEIGVEHGDIPADAVTASASGLDPHISPAYAAAQVPRVAWERGIPEPDVRALVEQNTHGRDLGLFGEPRVNVLMLNLALDEMQGAR